MAKTSSSSNPARKANVCALSSFHHSNPGLRLSLLAAAPPPPKEEKEPSEDKPKDASEPSDQQVNKKLPTPPEPSSTDKVSGGRSTEGDKKEFKKEEKKSEKKDKGKEEKSKDVAPRPAPGNRTETRVNQVPFATGVLYLTHAYRSR